MRAFLLSIAPFSDEAIQAIQDVAVPKIAKSGDQLFLAGTPFLKMFFIRQGLIRAYRVMDGKDLTFFFFTPQEFAVDYQSYLTETDSALFFEALTDVSYLVFTKTALLDLYQRFPLFERLGRIMAERAYLSATQRLKEFQAERLEDRYRKLLERNPELFQQIPQYHVATFLGVSPQSLSRLRARLQGKEY